MINLLLGVLGLFMPMDVFELEYFRDPQISPDGSQVVVVKEWADVETDQRYTNLWLVSTDGSGARPLTSGRRTDSCPRWAPDGKCLAYLSKLDETLQIHLWDGELHQLTNLEESPGKISWSPDGRWIAFSCLVPEQHEPLIQLPSAPEGADWAPSPTVHDTGHYRADSSGYLRAGYSELFVVSANGGEPRQITSGQGHHGRVSWQFDPTPAWSADSQWLIAAMMPNLDAFDGTRIMAYSLSDGTSCQLTPDHIRAISPAVSPDGQWIAFTGHELDTPDHLVHQLYLMGRNGEGLRSLSADLDRSVFEPRWTADGNSICFYYDDRGITKLGCYTLRGEFRYLAEGLGSCGLAYGALSCSAGFSLAADGRFVFNTTRANLPSALHVGQLHSSETDVLLASSVDNILPDAEELCYSSPLDGVEIQGWIIKPPQFNPQQRWPLIIHLHGGPQGNFGARFDVNHQLWAAGGYVVLYINYRGSTSYGEQFGQLGNRRFPQGTEQDVLGAVDAMVATGYIDAENLFLTGKSAGGCATCWTIAHTDCFKGAAASCPPLNWTSVLLTSDIGPWAMERWFGQTP